MPSLSGLNLDEGQQRRELLVAMQTESLGIRRQHYDIPLNCPEDKEFCITQMAGRHEENAAEAGAANAISPAQRVITQHQATEGASSDVQPVVIRQPSGVDRDRQAAHNQWAFTSPPHPKSRIPRREAVSKAIDCGVATEQLASNMEVPPSKAMGELNLGQDPKTEHKLLETEAKEFEKMELEKDVEYEMVEIDEEATFEKVEKEEAEMGDWEEV